MTSIVRRHRPWVPAAPSWRALLTLILVVSACAYVIPVERSMGRLTATKSNVSVLSSGTLLAPAAVVPVATGANSIRVAWTQSASPFATGYAIYRISGVEQIGRAHV